MVSAARPSLTLNRDGALYLWGGAGHTQGRAP